MPAPVRTPTSEAIAEYVQSLIFDGELRSGARIDREQIARDVRTSPIPVREALFRLEAEGTIVIEPHRGAFVAPITEETVREHWEVRGLLIGLVVAKIARLRDPGLVAEMKSLVKEMQGVADVERFNELALETVRLMTRRGATAKLRNLQRQFSNQVPGNFYARIPDSIPAGRRGFSRIVSAIEAEDPDAAQAAAMAFMRKEGDLVMVVLRANGVLASASDNGARRGSPAER
jgi:DNA-binding GntR family transcriptional regulator